MMADRPPSPAKLGNEEAFQQIFDLFKETFHIETLRYVAASYGYDVEMTCNSLLEMANNFEKRIPDKPASDASEQTQTHTDLIRGSKPDETLHSSTIPDPWSRVKSKKEREFDRIVELVRQGFKVLVIMRGLPGSGKSYLARMLVDQTVGDENYREFIFSTDDYFMSPNGVYNYDRVKLQDAHINNQRLVAARMREGVSPLVVDNTNLVMGHMLPYAISAVNHGYMVEIIEPFTHWATNLKELERRNLHGVHRNQLEKQLERFERNITPAKLLSMYNLTYHINRPLWPRRYPPINRNKEPKWKANKSASPNFDLISFDTIPCHPETSPLQPLTCTASTSCFSNKPERDLNTTTEPGLKKHCTRNAKTNVYPRIDLSSWGLTNHTLESWNFVTPIQDPTHPMVPQTQEAPTKVKPVYYVDAETNTYATDFLPQNPNKHVIITARSRDINAGLEVTPPQSPPKKAKLDKSSMTHDPVLTAALTRERDALKTKQFEELITLFPEIPVDSLRDIFDKCRGDLNWAVDLLLDDNRVVLDVPRRDDWLAGAPAACTTEWVSTREDLNTEKEEEDAIMTDLANNTEKIYLEREERSDLKKHIEENIQINSQHYSDHVRKIRNMQRGIADSILGSSSGITFVDTAPISRSDSDEDVLEETTSPAQSEDDCEIEPEMMQLNLGEALIDQLDAKFGLHEAFPRGFQPIVQVPMSLAKQLYALYLESVFQQMEAQEQILEIMRQEDEEFARKLQEKEYERREVRATPSLYQIMNDQMLASIHEKKVADKLKEVSPDDLASQLTRRKLAASFPSVNPDILNEVLHAHGNSYTQTVEVLLASTRGQETSQNGILEPPISDAEMDEMRLAVQECEEVDVAENRSAQEYRDDAGRYYRNRQELFQRATRACMQKQYEVAAFYSDLAQKQTQLYDKANNLAATTFLHENSQMQNFNTLDLHYLYRKEAIEALDIFLDNNIMLLRGSTTNSSNEQLFVITGRGKRSSGGVSKLKPVVIAKLKSRGVRFVEINPGLLRVKISKNSKMTNELNI